MSLLGAPYRRRVRSSSVTRYAGLIHHAAGPNPLRATRIRPGLPGKTWRRIYRMVASFPSATQVSLVK